MDIVRADRRQNRRINRSLGVEFEGAGPMRRIGILRDASATGILATTLNRFAAGEEVTVTIHSSSKTSTRVRARIVRVEPIGADARYPWRYLTAAEFVDPVWDLERVQVARAS